MARCRPKPSSGGTPRPDYKAIPLEFGSYVQVYDGTSNDVRSRTLGAIAMYPTFNVSGDYYFMSLATGARVHRRSWSPIPINDMAISRVEAIALQEDMPLVQTTHHIAEHDSNLRVEDDEYDGDYHQPTPQAEDSGHEMTEEEYSDVGGDELDSDPDDDDDNGHSPEFDDEPPPRRNAGEPGAREIDQESGAADNDQHNHPEVERDTRDNAPSEPDKVPREESGANNDGILSGSARAGEPAAEEGTSEETDPSTARQLRPNRSANYKYRFGFNTMHAPDAERTHHVGRFEEMVNVNDKFSRAIHGFTLTQMSAAAGIKKHGEKAREAIKKEFCSG